MAALKVLFLGGSNTRLWNGYVRFLVEKLRNVRGVEKATNLSVGISPCTMGIEQFLRHGDDDYDLVIIEYAINDSILVGERYDFWLSAYEGLIRLVQRRMPGAVAVGLIFGQRPEGTRAAIACLRDGMARLAAAYDNFHVVDVDAFVRSTMSTDEAFLDDRHYSLTAAVRIASHVGDTLLKLTNVPASRHATVSARPFDGAEVLSFDETPQSVDFTNTTYDVTTSVLRPGESLRVSSERRLVSLSFVSRSDSGLVEIRHGGQITVLPTYHSFLSTGAVDWLLLSLPLFKVPAGEGASVEVRAVGNQQTSAPPLKWPSMLPAQVDNPSVYVRGLLAA